MKTEIPSHMPPLIVDLDGTLVCTDLLVESAVCYIKSQPWNLLRPIYWLFEGKAHLKAQLAKEVDLNVATLPYNPDVIQIIEREKAKGRKVVLATASHQIYAERIASHLKLFDQVIATTDQINLSGTLKRDALIKELGARGFDYIGNSHDDLPVWAEANAAYLVNTNRAVENRAKKLGNVEQIIGGNKSTFKAWLKSLRCYQWVKNLLVFIPLLAGHYSSGEMLLKGLLAFFFFGLSASSMYILNDLLDLQSDRVHSTKRNRPFASGQLSIMTGLVTFPFLLLMAFFGSYWLLPSAFATVLTIYCIFTLAYSVRLKRMVMVDVVILALLYTIRIIGGAFAIGLNPTFWMLAFSMFIFLSLAFVKRYAELREGRHKGQTKKTVGRGYYPTDLEMISSLGGASGYLSVLVLALYIHDESTVKLYQNPTVIWLACPILLFWISRIWIVTHRGEMHDDPIVYAIKDRISLAVAALFGLLFWLAI